MVDTARLYRFGAFRLDPAKRLLTFNRQPILIAPKPFDTLLALVERNGLVVRKDELIKLIWADTYVEEANLSQNIFLLRKLLGKDNAAHRYIETVPRQGYRFIGKVREEQHSSTDVGVKRARDHTIAVHNKFLTSLAVLPLINASADPETEHVSDGLTEALINNLSQASHLRIVSRTTAFRYKGQEISVEAVGHETKVDHVLTGRVLVQGDEFNVQIDLNSVADESQFWGKQYEFGISNESIAQREISKDVLAQLELKLARQDQQRGINCYTNNREAYQLYLKGCYQQNKFTEEGLKKGIEYFQQAVDKEPNCALAYTGLAECYALGGLTLDPDLPGASKAKAAASMAIEIDDTLAEAHASVGLTSYLQDWNWSAAEREYRHAIELKPDYAKAHYWLSLCLRTMGRLDDALEEAKLAQELDPLMHIINVELGRTFYFARCYDRAIEHYREVLELEPNFIPAHFRLGQAYVQKGMYEEAIAEFQGDNPPCIAALAHVYALSGHRDEARCVRERLEALSRDRYVSSYDLAIIHVGLDDKDKAFESLQAAHAERSDSLIGIQVEPALDNLHADPRFAELVQQIGFTAPAGSRKAMSASPTGQ